MSYTDYYSSDPDWKEPKMRTPKLIKVEVSPTSSGKNKYSQKFCEKWLSIFSPWLARCEDDPNKPFCRACQCRLDCNRCHLQRHERTSKHARNLEILVNKGEGAARQNLSIRQERSKYYQQRRKLYPAKGDGTDMDMEAADDEYADESVTEFQFVQTEAAPGDQYNDEPVLKQEPNVRETKHSIAPKNQKMLQVRNNNNSISGARKSQQQQQQQQQQQHNRGHQQEQQHQLQQQQQQRKGPIQSLMQIQKDKSDLMDSIKEIMGNSFQQSPPREKNHVDLFFESVSSSVKALSPKLIAEAKMRVSQLICELELRGLTESSDVNTSAGNVGSHAVVVATQDGGGNAFIIGQPPSANNDDNGGITIS